MVDIEVLHQSAIVKVLCPSLRSHSEGRASG